MSEATTAATEPWEGPSSLRRATAPLRTAYHVLLGGPMKEGRLSFEEIDPASRRIAIGGLVALVAMMCSLLLNEQWRAGALVAVGTQANPALLPQILVPVTLVALFVAWLLIVWGAYKPSLWVRAAVCVVFLALNATMARPDVLQVNSSLAIRWTPGLALATYTLVPTVLLLAPELRRWRVLDQYARPASLGALVAGTGIFFGATLWAQAGQLAAGVPLTIPGQLEGAVIEVQAFLLPMVAVSVLSIIGLDYSVTEAASGPFWALSEWAAKGSLLALLAVKIWREIVVRAGYWSVYLRQREAASVRTLLRLGLRAGLALLARRFRPRARASEEAKEGVAYISAFVLYLPVLVVALVGGARAFLVNVLASFGPSLSLQLPANWLSFSSPMFWGAVLAVAVAMLVRHWRHETKLREAALGLAVMAVWAESFFVPEAFGYEPGFNFQLVDSALTVGAAIYLIVRWRALKPRSAVWLGALVGFSWLVSARGDLIGLAGSLVGLSSATVLAIGLAYALLTDSEFTRRPGRMLPKSARPLLWVGYLLLSATLANWVLATHGPDPIEVATRPAFLYLGLPLAAWLLTWRPFERVKTFEADETA